MFNYERDYGQKNGEAHTERNTKDPPVIPRINSELFCERKELGICHRSAAFAVIVAISAWPTIAAAEAIDKML